MKKHDRRKRTVERRLEKKKPEEKEMKEKDWSQRAEGRGLKKEDTVCAPL